MFNPSRLIWKSKIPLDHQCSLKNIPKQICFSISTIDHSLPQIAHIVSVLSISHTHTFQCLTRAELEILKIELATKITSYQYPASIKRLPDVHGFSSKHWTWKDLQQDETIERRLLSRNRGDLHKQQCGSGSRFSQTLPAQPGHKLVFTKTISPPKYASVTQGTLQQK